MPLTSRERFLFITFLKGQQYLTPFSKSKPARQCLYIVSQSIYSHNNESGGRAEIKEIPQTVFTESFLAAV